MDKQKLHENDVKKRIKVIEREHPDGAYPSAFPWHKPGECVECDALRELESQENQ